MAAAIVIVEYDGVIVIAMMMEGGGGPMVSRRVVTTCNRNSILNPNLHRNSHRFGLRGLIEDLQQPDGR